MVSRPQNQALRQRREQELDDLLEALLDAKTELGRVGQVARSEALATSAALLSEGARALSREAERLDPSPWHAKMWRKIKQSR
jgi:hypothetical protein